MFRPMHEVFAVCVAETIVALPRRSPDEMPRPIRTASDAGVAHDLVFAALEVAVVAEVRELGGRGDCDAVVVCAESVEVAVFEVEGWWQVF